jgi:prephenate dehydrogenase
VGTGLIGGSVGLALRARGWHVTGSDADPERAQRALELGALDALGEDPGAEVVVVATPVSAVSKVAQAALADEGAPGGRVVTDVGGVKAPVVAAVDHPRFVGGHPMAGSEQEGVDGADAALFEGATWVLTPTSTTNPEAFARLGAIVSSFGAEVLAIPPEGHDALVALVSHVPHLTAATLMDLAADGAQEHAALLRLAAGGFRDMTRIAAGHPGIWPDICAENREAIVAGLDRLLEALGGVRRAVAAGDRGELMSVLERARTARRNLPARGPGAADLVELRVPVADRPGALAEVTTLAGRLGANIADLEIAHSAEGDRGVVILVVGAASVGLVRRSLVAAGLRPSSLRRLD